MHRLFMLRKVVYGIECSKHYILKHLNSYITLELEIWVHHGKHYPMIIDDR
jgi:hypothetical protein